ncbi:MAG: MFS transporter [Thermoleophilia bacterium]|nr:MFS transporter [Thermoleophilia bacterium]
MSLRGTFAALGEPNYRRYFAGQAVSLAGTWMQAVAQSWLVLQLTHSGTWLGLVAAAQFLPVLLFAPYGGVLADRVDKRRMLMATQAAFGVQAVALGLLTVTGAVRLWMVVVLALLFGLTSAADNPARQAFASEMVPPHQVRNAVTLNSILVNSARAVGPAVAGILIGTVGTGICFLVNATTYAAVLGALATMDTSALRPAPQAARAPGQLREGLRYVRATPGLLVPLMMLLIVGMLAYEFAVVLPVLAHGTFHGGPGTFALIVSAMGAGAVAGGLLTAGRSATGVAPLSRAALVFGIAIAVAAAAPTLALEVVAIAAVGAASIMFLATGNSTLQLESDPRFRGRVMALWSVAFLGSTPLGGPVIGAIADWAGPRVALGVGAAACIGAGALGAVACRRMPRRGRPALAAPAVASR